MAMDPELLAQLVDSVRRYTREKLVPIEEKVADEDRVPDEVIQDFRDMGLFGLTTPERYGGLGLASSEEIEIIMEMCWSSAAFRSVVGINLGLGSQGILMDGTEEQRDYWLPRMASGEVITSFCLTEPDSGSDSAALQTRAVRDGDDYILNGTKRFITNAPIAGLFLVMARTHPERLPKNAHVTAFLVPADTPGVRLGKKDRKMGQSGAWSSDVYLEDVRVPASAIVGGVEGKGFGTAMKSLDRGRINVSSVCIGQARRILHEATKYAVERKQFGHPIGEFQLIQAMLADSRADLYAAECMLRDVARRYDSGERVSLEASCTKMFASEMVGRIADRAVQIHGGAGYMRDSAVERFYRDVRVFRIYEGTTQIQQTIIGKELIRRMAEA
ncbi:acyl-CoA dehydrogenase [Sphingobium indicum]|uniref:Acyl-CoA dehydrogenase n=1 Tax=Sphingobium indicum TaxID=332055 RepID=A0A4Q4J668_9SPHN|nr:acyl-CoA dehydrogenase family protein [Sphingobium indicum]NYI23623.1 acyl-CoA dehydrogenase [Sphingobium indicum]RYM01528.1 acyl-CoA dehydrogenase [Sphingobium indicum]